MDCFSEKPVCFQSVVLPDPPSNEALEEESGHPPVVACDFNEPVHHKSFNREGDKAVMC